MTVEDSTDEGTTAGRRGGERVSRGERREREKSEEASSITRTWPAKSLADRLVLEINWGATGDGD